MSFSGSAEAYDRFMGRYSRPLASVFVDFVGPGPRRRVLDVGCGPGALTSELVERYGPGAVVAVDPSESFVAAVGERNRDVEVHTANAEKLPFADGEFDAVLAQLVVHFMSDPVAGIIEMRRVTSAGGVVGACVWDHAEGGGPLNRFWEAVHEIDPAAPDEGLLPGTRQGDLGELFRRSGLTHVSESPLSIGVTHTSFDDWWEPFTLGVGPAGAYVASLDSDHVARLREQCQRVQPEAPFTVQARAWAARGRVAGVP